jgi:hypothetical protein
MDMIALPEWSPSLITERTGWVNAALRSPMNSKAYFALLSTYARVHAGRINNSDDVASPQRD